MGTASRGVTNVGPAGAWFGLVGVSVRVRVSRVLLNSRHISVVTSERFGRCVIGLTYGTIPGQRNSDSSLYRHTTTSDFDGFMHSYNQLAVITRASFQDSIVHACIQYLDLGSDQARAAGPGVQLHAAPRPTDRLGLAPIDGRRCSVTGRSRAHTETPYTCIIHCIIQGLLYIT